MAMGSMGSPLPGSEPLHSLQNLLLPNELFLFKQLDQRV
jgi:hypothetical protein